MTGKVFTAVISVLLMASFAAAGEIGGVILPDSLMAGQAKLVLNGGGVRKKAVVVKVYAGGLYLLEKSTNSQNIIEAQEPMAIRMHFIYDGVSPEKLIDGWNESFGTATGGKIEPIKKEIDAFNACFTEEAKANDIYDLVYIPDNGVQVHIKGVLKGTVQGFDFKKALFSIWLGDEPVDSKLKDAMLGK